MVAQPSSIGRDVASAVKSEFAARTAHHETRPPADHHYTFITDFILVIRRNRAGRLRGLHIGGLPTTLVAARYTCILVQCLLSFISL